MSWRYDPELDEIFTDPEERLVASMLSAVQAPRAEPDPAFRSQLRRELMAEAWRRGEPRMPWWRKLTAPAPAAWGMATVGALLIAAAVFYAFHPGGGANTVLVSYNVDITKPVAAVQPLDVQFTQPMDRGSVEQAVQITPATAVDYQWVSDKEVKITPIAGTFAPNTQYTVSLQPSVAKSQSGSAVTQATPAVFTVKPTPAPLPTPTPSPTPTPAQLQSQKLAAALPARPAWLSSTSLLYVSDKGELVELSIASGGGSTVLLPSDVRGVVARPDGLAALVLTKDGVSEVILATRVPVPIPGSAGALAYGYDANGKPWVVTSAAATSAAAAKQHKLAVTATAAWLSPKADGLVYQTAQDIRFVDLGTEKETVWPSPFAAGPLPAILGWSPDERHVLFAGPNGLMSGVPDGSSPGVVVASDVGVASADWSSQGAIVYATGSGVFTVSSDGAGRRPLSDGAFQSLAWQPGAQAFAYTQDGALWRGALTSPAPVSTPPLSVDEATKTVSAFMDARVAGQATTAQGLLATAARASYPQPALTGQADPKLSRWFMVAALPDGDSVRCDVRLVFADHAGRDVAQLDEMLTVARDAAAGKLVVASAAVGPQRPYGKGPEVINVQVAPGGVMHVQFDSDLLAPTIAAVTLVDATGKPISATTSLNGTREVVLTPTPALAPGTAPKLVILTTLRDKDLRALGAEFDLALRSGS